MVIAHAGHWIANLAYAAPVIGLLGWLGVVKVKESRARKRGETTGNEQIGPIAD
jgi:hypothetical protein